MALDEEKLKRLWPNAKNLEIAQCRQALAVMGFELPMFAIVASSLRLRTTEKVPTAAINRYGVCFVNPDFVKSLTMAELSFVLAHEAMHLLVSSCERQQHREPIRWNKASDRSINQVLLEITQTGGHENVIKVPDKAKIQLLFPLQNDQKSWEAERLYEVEQETPTAVLGGNSSRPNVGGGCGVDDLPNDEGVGEDLDPSTANRTPELIWRSIAEQAKALSAGTQAGQILARVVDPPKARISWGRLLRRTISQVLAWPGRDDQSWQRRNRRYYGSEFVMPGYQTAHKNVAIIVDTSGSMSDDAIARCVAEVRQAACHPDIRIYLVVHDAEVQWNGWLNPNTSLPAVWSKMKGRGGTLFEPAYAVVAEQPERFDALVHLTDGGCFGEWPARPSNVMMAIAALVGYGDLDHAPANYRKILVETGI